MNIIQKQPNPSGAYPPIQSWSGLIPPDGYYQVAEDVELSRGGFGELTVGAGIVTAFTPDVESWERWQAEHPATDDTVQVTQEDIVASLLDMDVRLTMMEQGGQ